jgi:hypothetical protein
MNKIPVGATIAHAYRFAFGSSLKIFGATWIALALQSVLSFVMMHRMAEFMTALMARDPSAIGQFGPLMLIYPFVIILFFVQITAVTELALNPGKPIRYFGFPIGKPTWRMVGAFILATLAIAAAILIFVIAAIVLGFILRMAGASKAVGVIAGLLVALAILIGYGAVIYAISRFYFLLAPVTVAEERIALGRAWKLTQGNFWRIFLIILAIFIPVMIAEYAVIFSAIGLPPVLPHGTTPEAFQALREAKLAWNLAMFAAVQKYWYAALPFFIALMIFWLGTSCGAQVFAYRKLTEDEGLVPVAGD